MIIGVDIGKERDYTAISIIERDGALYKLRRLERLPLDTNYVAVCERIRTIFDSLVNMGETPVIGVDKTGVGNPIVDLLRRMLPAARVIGINITAGYRAERFNVPKRTLISNLQILFQNHKLKMPSSMPGGNLDGDWLETFVDELTNYQFKITESANIVYDPRDSRYHDDLVLSVAIACYLCVRFYPILEEG